MDLFAMGSVSAYAKNWELQTQWELKQKSGDVTGKGRALSEWLQDSQGLKGNKAKQAAAAAACADAMRESREQGDDKLKNIMNKLYAGGRLTQEEREYLRAKDPEAWQKLKAAEQEQKAYEGELKRCRTKEEVQRVKMARLNASLNTVKSVENNPHIPLEKKLEIAMQEKLKCDRVQESTQRFVEKGEYDKLPTQAEQAQADHEANEAGQPEGKPLQEPEQAEGSGKEPEPGPEESARPSPAKGRGAEAEPAAGPESEQARKVRRARAKAAYTTASAPEAEPQGRGGRPDVKI